MAKFCAYCELPEIKERLIAENELAWAFPTNLPIVPGHLLIAPKRCVETVDELSEEEIKALFALRAQLKSALIEAFQAEGFNYAWNEGINAGQTVPHVHIQMLPRKKDDTGITEYEPRQFLYRPGTVPTTPEAELQSITKLIKSFL